MPIKEKEVGQLNKDAKVKLGNYSGKFGVWVF
jgi:hypothetical protein